MTPSPWLVCPRPQPTATVRLVCFPYAGAGSAVFAPWSRLLPAHVELHIALLPGRERRLRETPARQMTALVPPLAAAVAALPPKRTVFFGHSMGALVAFEVTRALHRTGRAHPERLIVSARRAPTVPDPRPPLHHLPDEAFLDGMSERYGAIPAAIRNNKELMAMFLPALKADMAVYESYAYQANDPLPIPVHAWVGRQDPALDEDNVSAWQQETDQPLQTRWFSGGHFYIQTERTETLAALEPLLA